MARQNMGRKEDDYKSGKKGRKERTCYAMVAWINRGGAIIDSYSIEISGRRYAFLYKLT
jgi:hypothetical protein